MPEVKSEDIQREMDEMREAEGEERFKEFESKLDAAKTLAEIGVPKIEGERKPFAALLNNEADLRRVFEHIEATIWRSFAEDIRRNPLTFVKPTYNEARSRFKLCETWFRHARGELGYSLEQTLDLMGRALRCWLDGVDFEPAKAGSRIWTPT